MRRQEVYISIGSNDPINRSRRVSEAIEYLSGLLADVRHSDVYTSAPLSGHGSDYCNAVLAGFTEQPSTEVEMMLKRYELEHGRTVEARKAGLVPVDLDLVAYGTMLLRPKDASAYYFRRGLSELGPVSDIFTGASESEI